MNGTTNTLADASGHNKKAAFQSKGQLIFNGNGALQVTGNTKNGIHSDDYIKINSGNISVLSAVNDGLHCDYFIMNDGQLTVNNVGSDAVDGDEGFIQINGGSINITLPTADTKGLKCDSTITINGGDITMTVAGNQAKGIKSGKGINVEGALTIGNVDAADELLNLTVATSGAQFLVSGSSGGGGWPPGPGGNSGDYANPKAIKSVGNLTVNSGIITVNCTQSGEGGEGLESKAILTINGGQLNIVSVGDDAINASSRLNINGGTTYATSTNNDGIDSNGPMYITGGFTIAAANKAPEEAFDCDNYTFSITGGTIIGTAVSGNMFSSPTASACTQHSLKYTHAANNSIQIIRNSDNQVILTFHVPTLSSSGGGGPGGGPGGGSSSAVMTFSSPEFTAGSYTLKYGGSISGGTNFHNHYTGASYTGGSTKTFTVGTAYSITSVN